MRSKEGDPMKRSKTRNLSAVRSVGRPRNEDWEMMMASAQVIGYRTSAWQLQGLNQAHAIVVNLR
jgi:hypothetical protein